MAHRRPSARPFIFILAGVNGAGKSSVGGALLEAQGLGWYNPDALARELVQRLEMQFGAANEHAWEQGRAQLEAAINTRANFALETTLGGKTITQLLRRAAATHDLMMIFVGLETPALHIQRVQERMAAGGHNIPEDKIRERWVSSRLNLVRLLPHLSRLQVLDNSAQVAHGAPLPDPLLLLEMKGGKVTYPSRANPVVLAATPDWARPIVQAAFTL